MKRLICRYSIDVKFIFTWKRFSVEGSRVHTTLSLNLSIRINMTDVLSPLGISVIGSESVEPCRYYEYEDSLR